MVKEHALSNKYSYIKGFKIKVAELLSVTHPFEWADDIDCCKQCGKGTYHKCDECKEHCCEEPCLTDCVDCSTKYCDECAEKEGIVCGDCGNFSCCEIDCSICLMSD